MFARLRVCVTGARRPPLVPAFGGAAAPVLHFRSYQHNSQHAPAAQGGEPSESRYVLARDWHRAARETTPGELQWEKRDEIEAIYMVLLKDGRIEKPEQKLKKTDILKSYGLQPRDLRTLDSHTLDVRPSLIACRRSIVLCTPIFRSIIAHDRIILLPADAHNPICDADGAEELVRATHDAMDHLGRTNGSATGSTTTPFELRALEALLLITARGFRTIGDELQGRVYSIIPELRFGVSQAELKDLMEAKRSCEDALSSGRALQSAISAVLSEDEDLQAMYLTDKVNGVVRPIEDHQAAELLLEFYERRLDETNESLVRLASLLSDVDNNIALILQSTRVRLQNLELQTAITTLALGAGTAIAGFFGMNLVSGLEEDPNAFRYAVYAGTGSMVFIMAVGWVRMVRNRRSQLFLRSFTRARPHTKAIQSRSLRIPSVGAVESAAGQEGKREIGSEVEKEGAKEAEKREQEAAKAQEEEEKKETSKDGSNL